MLHGFTAAFDGIVDAMSDTRLRIMSRVNITEPLPLAHRAAHRDRARRRGRVVLQLLRRLLPGHAQRRCRSAPSTSRRSTPSIPRSQLEPAVRRGDEADAQRRARRRGSRDRARLEDRRPDPARLGHLAAQGRGRELGLRDRRLVSFAVGQGADERALDQLRRTSTRRAPPANGTVTLYFVKIDESERRGRDRGAHRRAVRQLDVRDADAEREGLAARRRSRRSATSASSSTRSSAAVMFALLFVTGNTMMQSVRERIPELAVLKTYGFSNTAVVGLVLAESLVLCSVAAAIGIGIAAAISPAIYRELGAGGLNLPLSVVVDGPRAGRGVRRRQRRCCRRCARSGSASSTPSRAVERRTVTTGESPFMSAFRQIALGHGHEPAQRAAALGQLVASSSSASPASSPSSCRSSA